MGSPAKGSKLASMVTAKHFASLQPILQPLALIPYGPNRNFVFPLCDPQKMKFLRNTFKTRDNDVLLNSYPKSGNHFLKKCMVEIVRTADKQNTHSLYKTGDIGQDAIPHLEVQFSQISKSQWKDRLSYTSDANPCFWWFHQSVSDISCKDFKVIKNIPDITEKEAQKFVLTMKGKTILIVRNPKDVIVSGYYFWSEFAKNIQIDSLLLSSDSMNYTFDDYISYFYRGIMLWGCYFEFVQQWWALYAMCNKIFSGSYDGYNDKILWLYYEDLVDFPKESIQKMATFIGKDKQLNDKDYDAICESVKIENAKAMILEDRQSFELDTSIMRSGTNNNWQEIMTEKDSMRVDEMMYFKWAKYGKNIRYYQELIQNPKFKNCDLGFHNI